MPLTAPSTPPQPTASAKRTTTIACISIAVVMAGLSFAAVPLYRLICQTTGFFGTPQTASAPATRTSERSVFVRFDANVGPGTPWRFRPEVPEMKARLGETQTVFYRISNPSSRPATGVATFNVEPPQMGGYFVKIQCFCFTETTLKPGESIEAPVVFYIDPALGDRPELRHINSITLSYTVFPAKDGQPVAATANPADKPQL
jgi:cytochrome c oxidase assembly protein subunit 11